MHKTKIAIILFLLLFCSLALAQDQEQSLWVSSEKASLKAEASVNSETLEVLEIGEQVEVLNKEEAWYQVSTSAENTGWIYRGRLSETKPVQEEAGQSGDLFAELTGSSIQAQKADTSRSIRGLSPEAKAYAEETGTDEDYQKALDQVLAQKVAWEELQSFLQKGKIGEYAQE